ncbi:MAG: PIN domain-containing protein [bacterium]
MNGGADPIFVDTNVLVYASIEESPFHESALRSIQHYYEAGVEMWVSYQVLREYLAVLTRPDALRIPQPISATVTDIQHFRKRFRMAGESAQILENLLALIQEVPVKGKQIHDANIVATMMTHRIRRLLTHNTSDFDRFSRFITLLPIAVGT